MGSKYKYSTNLFILLYQEFAAGVVCNMALSDVGAALILSYGGAQALVSSLGSPTASR